MKNNSNLTVIWDWNGTLLDDGWLFVEVMNSILRSRGMNTITLEKYREIFGFPVKDYYLKLGFDLEKEPFEKTTCFLLRATVFRTRLRIFHGLSGRLGVKQAIYGDDHVQWPRGDAGLCRRSQRPEC